MSLCQKEFAHLQSRDAISIFPTYQISHEKTKHNIPMIEWDNALFILMQRNPRLGMLIPAILSDAHHKALFLNASNTVVIIVLRSQQLILLGRNVHEEIGRLALCTLHISLTKLCTVLLKTLLCFHQCNVVSFYNPVTS